MSDTHDIETPAGTVCRDDPKVRHCLRCQADFKSQWAGERICARCKSTNTWRSGVPVRASSSNGRG